jgi:hypothetical protein
MENCGFWGQICAHCHATCCEKSLKKLEKIAKKVLTSRQSCGIIFGQESRTAVLTLPQTARMG